MNEPDQRKELENKLGLDSITDLTPELFRAFLNEIPSMSKESVMAIASSLPDFQNLVSTSLDQLQSGTNSILESNWKSQKKVHSAYEHYRRMIDRELMRENLSPEERYRLLGLVKEAVDAEEGINSKHQAFTLTTVKTLAVAGGILGTAAIVVLGAALNNGKIAKV